MKYLLCLVLSLLVTPSFAWRVIDPSTPLRRALRDGVIMVNTKNLYSYQGRKDGAGETLFTWNQEYEGLRTMCITFKNSGGQAITLTEKNGFVLKNVYWARNGIQVFFDLVPLNEKIKPFNPVVTVTFNFDSTIGSFKDSVNGDIEFYEDDIVL